MRPEPPRSGRVFGLSLVALAIGAACRRQPTEIIVEVTTNLGVPSQIDRVEFEVLGAQTDASAVQEPDGGVPIAFPIRLGVLPAGSTSGVVDIRVIGRLGSVEIVRQRTMTHFVAEHVVVVPMTLSEDCLGVTCPPNGTDDQTCVNGACQSVAGPIVGFDGGDGSQPGTSVVNISAGSNHTCALRASGQVVCWGSNDVGQVGAPLSAGTVSIPRPVDGLPANIVAIALGDRHSCALTSDGEARCWGAGDRGQRGDRVVSPSGEPTPQHVMLPANQAGSHLYAGGNASCVAQAGNTYCWGANEHAQLALASGDTQDQSVPAISLAPSMNSLGLGGAHVCARRSGGLDCWGANSHGQLGMGFASDHVLFADAALINSRTFSVPAAGAEHSCAQAPIDDAGLDSVWCWGNAANGRLGNGATTPDQFSPVAINGTTRVTTIGAGGAHTCFAVGSVRRVSCTGANAFGQLGDDSTSESSVPVGVVTANGSLDMVDNLALGANHSCALRAGHVWCWGDNAGGKLGVGSTVPQVSVAAMVVGL